MDIITIVNKNGVCWKNGPKAPKTYKSVKSAERAIKADLAKQEWLHVGLFSDGQQDDQVEIFGKASADSTKKEMEQKFHEIESYLSECKVNVVSI